MESIRLVVAGHVDHGKSTIIGRLLADTDSLPQGKLEQVREKCRRNARPFEYAFLLDALKDEQSQGITIDAARIFFSYRQRQYLILDAPGHIEFIKNMVTGASNADGALLVIDAAEGIRENSRRHGYLLSLLGINRIIVLINKMDLIDYGETIYRNLTEEYAHFLAKLGIQALEYIPVSGQKGDNLSTLSTNMPWYAGPILIDAIQNFQAVMNESNGNLRMFVQDIYKFTAHNDTRRIVAGKISSGSFKNGDEIIFYPSGKKTTIRTIETFPHDAAIHMESGLNCGITLEEQLYIRRGELLCKAGEKNPSISVRFSARIFWTGKLPLQLEHEYILKLGANRVKMRVEKLTRVFDPAEMNMLEKRAYVKKNEVAECVIRLQRPIAFDCDPAIPETHRFVIVDQYRISGGGIIIQTLDDDETWVRNQVILRNQKWEKGQISERERAERLNQRSVLLLISGEKDSGKKPLAKTLEKQLFQEGKLVYFLGIRNILYGVDADISHEKIAQHQEHIRRMAEIAYIMLDLGAIVIITATMLSYEDAQIIQTVIPEEKVRLIWLGETVPPGIIPSLSFPQMKDMAHTISEIKDHLHAQGIIYRPW